MVVSIVDNLLNTVVERAGLRNVGVQSFVKLNVIIYIYM